MNAKSTGQSRRGLIYLFLIFLLLGSISIILWKGQFFSKTQEETPKIENVVIPTIDTIAATAVEAPTCAASITETNTPTTEEPTAIFDANTITLTNYTHKWLAPNALLTLQNNTQQTIHSITGRVIYYDMDDNQLGQQDFTEAIIIDPNTTVTIQLKGFGQEEHYAHHKADTGYSRQKKYKAVFQLIAYQ